MIVPGGGISLDGTRWVRCKPGFLLPVRVLSRLFRRLFLAGLADAHAAGRLAFFGKIEGLRRREALAAHLAPQRRKNWFVYTKPPFAGPEAVLAYLARYTHRLAISNSRLVALDERGVTLRYKDYRRSGQARYRTMTLRADEFIRRFLLHVLPKGFRRIRRYGLLASAWLQGQHCARQEADGRPNAGDRSAGSARHGRSAHHDRSSPVVPLLWRPHDHCRGLCARRRTARSPVLRPRHQNRNPMRLATTSLHHPLAGAPRSRRRATVISATANSDATPRAVPKSRCRAQQRRPIRDRQRQFALNDAGQRLSRPTRCPIKSP
jgi:Putative transposase